MALLVAQAQARLQGDFQPFPTIGLLARLIQRCEELGVSRHGGPEKGASNGTTRNPARKSKRAARSIPATTQVGLCCHPWARLEIEHIRLANSGNAAHVLLPPALGTWL